MERITINPDVCKGKPTIRNMRFTVTQMLELLASGMSHQEILQDYPFLEEADILACLAEVQVSLLKMTENLPEEDLKILKRLIIAFKAQRLAELADKVWEEKGRQMKLCKPF